MQHRDRLEAAPCGPAPGLAPGFVSLVGQDAGSRCEEAGGRAPQPARRDPAAGQSEGLAVDATGLDPDGDLVARAREGDRAAFEALLRRHYDRMHRIAWRMTGSRHDAEDVVQEVCCVLPGKLAGFRGQARFATWLFGVLANACRDHRRRGARFRRMREGLAVLVGLGAPRADHDPHRRVWLDSALGRLDASLRDALVLVAGEGLTHAEAGAALGIAESTVSWRLFEARRRLKESLGGEMPDV